MQNITGLSKKTFEDLQVDAGAAFKNLGVTDNTTASELKALIEEARNDTEKNIGATDGGFNFTATADTRQPSVDGLRAGIKGSVITNSIDVSLSFTSRAITPENWALAIGNASITKPSEDVTIITPRFDFDMESYTDEICFIGSMADQKHVVVVQLLNVLNTTGINYQSNNMGEGGFSFEMHAHLEDPWDEVPPYKIYYFDVSEPIVSEFKVGV